MKIAGAFVDVLKFWDGRMVGEDTRCTRALKAGVAGLAMTVGRRMQIPTLSTGYAANGRLVTRRARLTGRPRRETVGI